MKAKAKVVIAPLDLMKIRKELGISLTDMGTAIALYTEGCFNTPVPDTRINEWEKAVRHVPSYVYTACANIVLDHWTSDWHEAKIAKGTMLISSMDRCSVRHSAFCLNWSTSWQWIQVKKIANILRTSEGYAKPFRRNSKKHCMWKCRTYGLKNQGRIP